VKERMKETRLMLLLQVMHPKEPKFTSKLVLNFRIRLQLSTMVTNQVCLQLKTKKKSE
jgi:hypothetical protein